MLVLTRLPRKGQDTVVATVDGTTIRFKTMLVDGSKVRVEIDTPEEVTLVREEVLEPADHIRD